MPRLVMFAACEKVIIGQGDNNVSLISILHSLQLNSLSDAPSIPKNAAMPLNWAIFTMWQKESKDENISYSQRVSLVSPKGKTLLDSVTSFQLEKDFHRVTNTIIGLPVGEDGPHSLKLSLSRTDSDVWNDISSFPMIITHPSSVRSSSLSQ
jgi:hypothetical protein